MQQPVLAAYPSSDHRTGPQNGNKRHKSIGGMTITKYAPPPQQSMHPGWAQPQIPGYNPYLGHHMPHPYAQPAQQPFASYAGYSSQPPGTLSAYYGQNAFQSPVQFNQQYTHGPHTAHPSSESSVVWPGAPANSATRSQSMDERAMPHQKPASTEHQQPYFEFTAGNGPAHDAEVPEDAEEYCEFTRPCSYAAKDSEIPKEFSLGLIVCKTARPSNTSLPATWAEANPDPSQPAVPVPFDPAKCPSAYHSESLKDTTLQPVRNSIAWEDVKDDLIFRSFPKHTENVVFPAQLHTEYYARPDASSMPKKHSASRATSSSYQARPHSSPSSRKRDFSQTEHDTTNEQNKRHREDHRSKNNWQKDRPRHNIKRPHGDSSSRRGAQHGAVGDGRPRHSETVSGNRSKIFDNGVLNPPRDGLAVPSNGTPGSSFAEGTESHKPQTTLGGDTEPAETSLPLVEPDTHPEPQTEAEPQPMPDQPVTSATQSSSAAQADEQPPSEAEVQPEPDTMPVKESAWTRLAREYQLGAKRDFDQFEDYGYEADGAGHQDKRAR